MNDIHTAPDSAPRQAWFQLDVHPYVFFISAGMIVLFVVLTLFFEQRVDDLFAQVQAAVSHYAGWFFVGVMNIVLIFVISLLLGRFGDIRLGGGYSFGHEQLHAILTTSAVVSAKIRSPNDTRLILFDNMVHDGDRGRPLVHVADGRIVGIVSGRFEPIEVVRGSQEWVGCL
jgi:hypothetical protein